MVVSILVEMRCEMSEFPVAEKLSAINVKGMKKVLLRKQIDFVSCIFNFNGWYFSNH